MPVEIWRNGCQDACQERYTYAHYRFKTIKRIRHGNDRLPSILDLIAKAGDDLGGELDVIAQLLTGEVAGDAAALNVHNLSQIVLGLVDGAGVAVGALPSAEHQCVGIGLALGVDGKCR